jgi:hypothetical protein
LKFDQTLDLLDVAYSARGRKRFATFFLLSGRFQKPFNRPTKAILAEALEDCSLVSCTLSYLRQNGAICHRSGQTDYITRTNLFSWARVNVLCYFDREILAFFNSPPKRFNEASISFVAAGLRSRSGCVW